MNENANDPSEGNEEENTKNENEFLKMKLMLEQGAHFGSVPGGVDLPAGLENEFLKNVIEFEKQFQERKTIKVFDKIERPAHFKPVNEIPDGEMDDAWDELSKYLQNYGLSLDVLSPNITKRELYRFATEELFNHEIDDMNVPGMMNCFTYDEFHPDFKYDNTNHAIEDCIGLIFRKDHVEDMSYFQSENLGLNDHYPVSQTEFKAKINSFKDAYEDILANEIKDNYFFIDDKNCEVRGDYDLTLKLESEEVNLKGNWAVKLGWDGDYWEISDVQIEGIRF